MKLTIPLLALSSTTVATAHLVKNSQGSNNARHNAYVHRLRQLPGAAAAAGTTTHTTAAVAAATTSAAAVATPAPTTPTVAGTVIPALSQITMGAAIETPLTIFTTFTAGATAPYSGAPALPTINIIPSAYPALDEVPDVNSPQVKKWLSEIDLSKVPNLQKTTDGSCGSDPTLAADQTRCWWTCGGCTRATDIVSCPTKLDWGVSFDDGPSPYTPKLVNYLHQENITATFFVVGSRVISRPDMLQAEYMLGHEISVHTWSHTPLTTLTNEQIVAELGWTRQSIKDILGVSPRSMRPPYGDIDDRVRAVCMAMGLTPIIWTGTGDNEFDTDDWKIAGGTATGPSSFAAWQKIEAQAVTLNTGFIVLEHDLYQQSVDLAVGYIIPDARTHNFKLKSVIECLNEPAGNAFAETYASGNSTTSSYGNDKTSTNGTSTKSTTTTDAASGAPKRIMGGLPTVAALVGTVVVVWASLL